MLPIMFQIVPIQNYAFYWLILKNNNKKQNKKNKKQQQQQTHAMNALTLLQYSNIIKVF